MTNVYTETTIVSIVLTISQNWPFSLGNVKAVPTKRLAYLRIRKYYEKHGKIRSTSNNFKIHLMHDTRPLSKPNTNPGLIQAQCRSHGQLEPLLLSL